MTRLFLAQIESTIDQAERLAGQNDRVLFIVTLILFFAAGGVAMKWFMNQLKERDTALEAQRVASDVKMVL
jgi:flagellar basal body-associated protein FliL